jgi:O-antigen/teichoic acid export membrane protein
MEMIAVADGQVRSASIFIVVVQVTKSSLLIVAGVVWGTIEALIVAAVLQGALQCAILFTYLRGRFGRFWREFDWPLFRAQLRNALPYGLGALVLGFQADLNKYFVSYYFDPAGFAIYSVGLFQLPVLILLVDSITSVLIPEVSRLEMENRYDRIIEVWSAVVRRLAFFFIPACALLFTLRAEFITALFTSDYAGAAPIFAVNLISTLLCITVTGPILRAFDGFRYFRLKLYLLLIPVTGVVLYAGIQTAGMAGAIVGDVLIQLLAIGITIAALGRALGATVKDLRRLLPLFRIAAAASVAMLAAFFARLPLTETRAIVVFLVCSAVFCAVYIAAALLFGAVTEIEKGELRGLFSRFVRLSSSFLRLSPVGESK